MTPANDAWLARHRARWLRPNAHLYVRPDAHRFMRPDAGRYLQPERKHHLLPGFERTSWQKLLEGKAGFDPNQPRVPKGDPDGGQWTRVGSLSGGRGRNRFGGNFPGATYGQLIRLDRAIGRTEEALAQIRRFEPNWQPTASSLHVPGSIEGEIRHAEVRAEQASARLDQLRSGIGGNFGPPLQEPSQAPRAEVSTSRPFDGPAWISAYRSVNSMPDLFGQPTWPKDKGTVAVTEIEGVLVFGVNSRAPGYGDVDQAEADQWRQALIKKFPNVMQTRNIGAVPNNSLYHAEATILVRAARENNGDLAGRNIVVHVDRPVCWSCGEVLPLLALELGNPTVTYVEADTGRTSTMHNGRWLPGSRR